MYGNELLLAGLLCQQFNRVTAKLPPTGPEWEREEGMLVYPAQDLVRREAEGRQWLCSTNAFENIEFELLVVTDAIRPHYHKHTDSVVVVLDCSPLAANWQMFVERAPVQLDGSEPIPLVLREGDLFVLPRMVVHGFLPHPTSDDRPVPLYLLSASCPKFDPKDTHYV